MLQSTAFEVFLKFPPDISRQEFVLAKDLNERWDPKDERNEYLHRIKVKDFGEDTKKRHIEAKIILDSHKKWLIKEEGGKKADFSYKRLEFFDLSDIDLSEVNFYMADISASKFLKSNLTGANFEGADANRCKFNNAVLTLTNFKNADLSGVWMEDVHAHSANFENANLEDANISNADFRYANLVNTNFYSVEGLNVQLAHTILANKEEELNKLWSPESEEAGVGSILEDLLKEDEVEVEVEKIPEEDKEDEGSALGGCLILVFLAIVIVAIFQSIN